MNVYTFTFQPIYVPKIWGGRNLDRLFGRDLPGDEPIGESWELADLTEGVSTVLNGPAAGTHLTQLTRELGADLLGPASPMPDGRFPLLLKLLDANDILSLQVHPDAEAVREIGGDAALKTECWYFVESRDGYIYKGVADGVTPQQFRRAIDEDAVEQCVRRYDVETGEFHYLPAGTVHALGPGLVVAEVQTPSDTTYRVTDWGRGREIHVERSMQCIHFEPPADEPPGAEGETLLETEFFAVSKRHVESGRRDLPAGRCAALMMLRCAGACAIRHNGDVEPETPLAAGRTVLVPAALDGAHVACDGTCEWLEVTLPEAS